MLLIDCPFCGKRPELEFRYGGEAHISRPSNPETTSHDAWASYLYARRNPAGNHAERWHHVHGCRRFFNAIRHTVTDQFSATYPADSAAPEFEIEQ